MKRSARLRAMLNERSALVCPGAHDALSAKMIENYGFKALQVSGFGLSASYLGLPDMAFLSFADVLHFSKNVIDAVKIPVIVDADTGFGNAISAMYVTEQFIGAGAAGMNIEDQAFPKRCGHMEGKQLVSKEEMALKVMACKDVRDRLDPDFIINARTDAIAVEGFESAIDRANAYAEAGADLIFLEAPRSEEQIREAVKRIKAPVSINIFDAVAGGKTPVMSIEKLRELGVARVSIPVGPLFAAVKGLMDYLEAIRDDNVAVGRNDLVCAFSEFRKLVGYDDFRQLEKKYLPSFIENNM